MRRAVGSLLLTIIVASVAAASSASAESTIIHLNQSRRVMLRGTAANVIVSDPAVADVTLFDAHSVILLGKGYGATDVLVMDRAGRTLLDDHIMVAPSDSGVVTLHRGTSAMDYSCSPRCQALAAPKEGGAASPSAGPGAGAPTNPPASQAATPQ